MLLLVSGASGVGKFTAREPDDVARAVADWRRAAVRGDAAVFAAGWHRRR